MGRWPRCAVLSILGVVGAIGISPTHAVNAQADVGDVMLDDVGAGFVLVDESTNASGALTRTFQLRTGDTDVGMLQILGFAVGSPPGARKLFDAVADIPGFVFVAEPTMELARWMVAAGEQPGDGGASVLNLASRDHIFTISLLLNDVEALNGPALVLELAKQQIARAGAPEAAAIDTTRTVDDNELLQYLPTSAPAGFDVAFGSLTLSGATEFEDIGLVDPEVSDFLTERATSVAEAWGGVGLTLAVGITQYPYDVFAASGLAGYASLEPVAVDPAQLAPLPDAIVFRDSELPQVGIVFRRGDILVTALAEYSEPATEQVATALLVETASLVWPGLPPGNTSPYVFPRPLSRLAGLALTAGIVVVAVAGSRVVARLRARRVRRRWASDPSFDDPIVPTVNGTVIELDDDAARLRRRGEVVAGVQLLTIIVGVVALSGDFGWPGVVVAALSLIVGLLFTRWWLQREHALLGPTAPPKAFRVPRLAGAVIGIGAFAVLGFGAAYFLKGVRYVVFKPTLAQLRWSDLFGLAPRTVGVVFAIGGVIMIAIGAVLWRIARAFGRARVAGVLNADARAPVLYLRSFDDDAVPLPIIASARRPLFEFFSLRGADPFEECVAWELDSYGPVIAVGRPGGSLVSLGAAREHLPSDTWHDEIATRMFEAGSIVLAPGETAGLAWELRAIVEGGHLDKTIFVFPPLAPRDLARRWDHTADVLRAAGADVGRLPAPHRCIHTVQVGDGESIRATCASTRDEATYRTAVDRALEARAGDEAHQFSATA